MWKKKFIQSLGEKSFKEWQFVMTKNIGRVITGSEGNGFLEWNGNGTGSESNPLAHFCISKPYQLDRTFIRKI
jgi:hypothetical protein